MKLLWFSFVAIFLFFSKPSEAQQVSGNALYSACGSENAVELGFCLGFLLGAIEGESYGAFITLMRTEPETETSEMNRMINFFLGHCVPPDATNEQLRDVVLRYLGNHPEDRHFPARGLIWNALVEAFPCA